jgi:ArsR family transcriptional regulator
MNTPWIELLAQQSARIAKAKPDPRRFAAPRVIASAEEWARKDSFQQFLMTQATLSHHVRELVAAELIHFRGDGQMIVLRCRSDQIPACVRLSSQHLAVHFGVPPRT